MLADDLLRSLDPVAFVESMGITPYDWQRRFLRSVGDVIVVSGRQVGKSSATGWLALHRAVTTPGSLAVMVSPTQRQSSELLNRASHALKRFDLPIGLATDNASTLGLSNGSRLVSLPGSEASARGYSADLLVVDEAARVEEELWAAVKPMVLATGGRTILLSTPAGRRGQFWETWDRGGEDWDRFLVRSGDVLPAAKVAAMRAELGEWLAKQELDASFEESGEALFSEEKLTGAVLAGVPALRPTKGDDR